MHKQNDSEESSKDEPKFHKSSTGETTITKGFSSDNICDEGVGDIDLSTPMGIGNLPMKNEVIAMSFSVAGMFDDKCLCLIIGGSAGRVGLV
jgi:hypothetical protein